MKERPEDNSEREGIRIGFMKMNRIEVLLLILTVWMSALMPSCTLYAYAAENDAAAEETVTSGSVEDESEENASMALTEVSTEERSGEEDSVTDPSEGQPDNGEGTGGAELSEEEERPESGEAADDAGASDEQAESGEAADGAGTSDEQAESGEAADGAGASDEQAESGEAADGAGTSEEQVESEEAADSAMPAEDEPETYVDASEAALAKERAEEDGPEEEGPENAPDAAGFIEGYSAGTNEDERTADQLFEEYIRMEFGISTGKAKLRKASSGSRLTGIERNAYDKISEVLPLIASGKRKSTKITIPIEDLFAGCKNSWTAKELGVKALLKKSASSPNGWAITEEALAAMNKKGEIDLIRILVALLADHPYELYWFNKIEGYKMDDLDVSATDDEIHFKGEAVFSFTVEKEYADGEYRVNTKFGTTVRTAAQNAGEIVERFGSSSDLDKLRAYKDEICRLVTYDTAALTDYDSYGYEPYGNPWQLIWVFDGDSSTNVVCEGYAKAFQYLCDRSAFTSDISCLTVNGSIGERHMWNIVRMDDSANYLVDLTNCDEDACGYPDRLFLAGTDGSPEKGYHFDIDLYNEITYSYDQRIRNYYDDGDLRLSGSDYGKGKSLSAANVTLGKTEFTYDGARKLPAVTVTLDGEQLVEGTDYVLEYGENLNAGTGIAAVSGKGRYSGVKRAQFTILKAEQKLSVSPAVLTLKIGDLVSYSTVKAYEEKGHKVVKISGLEGELYVKSRKTSVAAVSTDPQTPAWVKAVAGGKAVIILTAEETENFKEKQIPLTVFVEPPASSKLNAVNLEVGMKVVWAPVRGADGYVLTRSDGTKSTNIRIKGGSVTEFTDRAANTNGKKYTYRLAATVENVTSTSAKTAARIRLSRPVIASITNSGAGKMTVRWDKNAKASGYQVQYSLRSDFRTFKTVNVNSAAAAAKMISGLTKSGTYYVRIRSFQASGSAKSFSSLSRARKVTIRK